MSHDLRNLLAAPGLFCGPAPFLTTATITSLSDADAELLGRIQGELGELELPSLSGFVLADDAERPAKARELAVDLARVSADPTRYARVRQVMSCSDTERTGEDSRTLMLTRFLDIKMGGGAPAWEALQAVAAIAVHSPDMFGALLQQVSPETPHNPLRDESLPGKVINDSQKLSEDERKKVWSALYRAWQGTLNADLKESLFQKMLWYYSHGEALPEVEALIRARGDALLAKAKVGGFTKEESSTFVQVIGRLYSQEWTMERFREILSSSCVLNYLARVLSIIYMIRAIPGDRFAESLSHVVDAIRTLYTQDESVIADDLWAFTIVHIVASPSPEVSGKRKELLAALCPSDYYGLTQESALASLSIALDIIVRKDFKSEPVTLVQVLKHFSTISGYEALAADVTPSFEEVASETIPMDQAVTIEGIRPEQIKDMRGVAAAIVNKLLDLPHFPVDFYLTPTTRARVIGMQVSYFPAGIACAVDYAGHVSKTVATVNLAGASGKDTFSAAEIAHAMDPQPFASAMIGGLIFPLFSEDKPVYLNGERLEMPMDFPFTPFPESTKGHKMRVKGHLYWPRGFNVDPLKELGENTSLSLWFGGEHKTINTMILFTMSDGSRLLLLDHIEQPS